MERETDEQSYGVGGMTLKSEFREAEALDFMLSFNSFTVTKSFDAIENELIMLPSRSGFTSFHLTASSLPTVMLLTKRKFDG